jgi:hypothetical protein
MGDPTRILTETEILRVHSLISPLVLNPVTASRKDIVGLFQEKLSFRRYLRLLTDIAQRRYVPDETVTEKRRQNMRVLTVDLKILHYLLKNGVMEIS